ncbi:hypothetical protein PG987_007841 [Apiospora arundinis]
MVTSRCSSGLCISQQGWRDPTTLFRALVHRGDHHHIVQFGHHRRKLGTVFLRFRPLPEAKPSFFGGASEREYSNTHAVPVKTTLHLSPPLPFDLPELKLKKVEELWWGGGFKGMDFHNRSGSHFRLLPDNSGCPPPPPSFLLYPPLLRLRLSHQP